MRWSAELPLDPPEPPECAGCDDLAAQLRRCEAALRAADELTEEYLRQLAAREAAARRWRAMVRRHAAMRPRRAA